MSHSPSTPHATRRALALGLAGFALLSLGDAVIKTIAGQWPGTAVAATRFALGAIGLGIVMAWRFGRAGFALSRPGLQMARGAALATATLCFFSSIFVMPLADATAILFVNPMITALISPRMTGERASRGGLAASAIALAGVALVLRPNVQALGMAALLPLGAATGMAVLMTLNRIAARDAAAAAEAASAAAGAAAGRGQAGAASRGGGVLAAQFWMALFATPPLALAAWAGDAGGVPALAVDWPHWSVVARIAGVAVSATCAHALIYAATARASSAAIAPTVYVQMLVALGVGVWAFGDRPDAPALAGTALIIAAGVLLWRSGRARAGG